MIRDRIIGFERIHRDQLIPDERNWRTHPESQSKAINGILKEVGIASALLVRKVGDKFKIIDGHLRQSNEEQDTWPCLILDVDEIEAAKLIATYDPIGAMAEPDHGVLESLLSDVTMEESDLSGLIDDMRSWEGQPWSIPDIEAADYNVEEETISIRIEVPKVGHKELVTKIEKAIKSTRYKVLVR